MHIKNKFLLIVLLTQPFNLTGGHFPNLPNLPVLPGQGIMQTASAFVGIFVAIYGIYWNRKMNPLQEEAARQDLKLKQQQFKLSLLQEEAVRQDLKLKQQQFVKGQIQIKSEETQNNRSFVQLLKELYEYQEKTDDEPGKKVDPEKVRLGLYTKILNKIDNGEIQPTQSNQALLSQPQKHNPEEREEKIKKLAQKTNTEQQLAENWEKTKLTSCLLQKIASHSI